MSYFVYMLHTSGNTYYIGQTKDVKKRLLEHKKKSGKSAKYLRMFSDFRLVYTEKFSSRTDAMKREAELKKWPRTKKEQLLRRTIS